MELFRYVIVVVIACVVAYSELLGRYREEPLRMLKVFPTYVYFLLNGMCAAVAYSLMVYVSADWTGIWATTAGKIVAASIASMALLRSSVFKVYVAGNEKPVEIGLGAIAQIFLDRADRSVDQARSRILLRDIPELTKNLNYDSAFAELPALCLYLMQNVTPDEEKALGKDVAAIQNAPGSNEHRLRLLIVRIARLTGLALLKAAVAGIQRRADDSQMSPVTSGDEIDKLLNILRSGTVNQERENEQRD